MKKILPGLLAIAMLFFGCAVNKPIANDADELKAHPQPFKIFGIGNWSPGYSILTLTDSSHQYFTIKAPDDPNLKLGDIYRPQL